MLSALRQIGAQKTKAYRVYDRAILGPERE